MRTNVPIRPPRFEGSFELGRGRHLGFAEYGPSTGRPILWFHGTPGARRQISPDAREAATAFGVRLIAVERPGIGASSPHVYASLVEWAHDLERFCDGLELDRIAIAGLSGGGPYALACAHEMPERVVAVALLGGVAPSVGLDAAPGGVSTFVRAIAPAVRATLRPLGLVLPRVIPALEPVAEQAMDLVASFMPPGDQLVFQDPRVRRMFIDDLLHGSRRYMQAFLLDAILFAREWGFSLRDIHVPVHMWYGDSDRIVPITHAEHLAEKLPRALLRVRPGEGHLGGLGLSDEIFQTLLAEWPSEQSRQSSA